MILVDECYATIKKNNNFPIPTSYSGKIAQSFRAQMQTIEIIYSIQHANDINKMLLQNVSTK